MFQSVRPNSQIYILHKIEKPFYETGLVATQPIVKPKYSIPTTFGTPQELVVDISVKIGDKMVNYTGLPAQQDIADTFSNGEGIVVADSKEAFNSEILTQKQKSVDIVKSKDYHEGLIGIYDSIYKEINPEYADKESQKEEIAQLKSQMGEMSKNMAELMKTNALLIERLSDRRVNNETLGN